MQLIYNSMHIIGVVSEAVVKMWLSEERSTCNHEPVTYKEILNILFH